MDLLDVPGASLRTLSAGSTAPNLFTFYLRQPERCLSNELAHTESDHPIPGTDRIAFPALIAEFDGVSTALFYLIDDLFKRGYSLHDFSILFFHLNVLALL
jgi:hypothetical protein